MLLGKSCAQYYCNYHHNNNIPTDISGTQRFTTIFLATTVRNFLKKYQPVGKKNDTRGQMTHFVGKA